MKNGMRLLVSVLLFGALLTGCGGKAVDNESSAVPENTPAATSSPVVASTPVASQVTAEWPRTYVDSMGNEVTLEKQPERVISVFHAMYPDYLYALGVYPVGVASADTLLSQWAAYKDYTAVQAVVDIGGPTAPNLEKILELEPDLILAASFHTEVYEELAKIAPTVVLDYGKINEDREYGIKEFSVLFGKEAQAQEAIDKVKTSIAEGYEKLRDFRAREESVIFISITEKSIWPYTVGQLQIIYDEEKGLGLKAPEGYSAITDRSMAISLETLAEYNPDHIFLMTDYGDETARQWFNELAGNSVWSSITAVRENNIYLTDRSVFAFNSPIATQYGISLVVESVGQ